MMRAETVVVGQIRASATPPLLKPLLFSISPAEVQCSNRRDVVAAMVMIATLHFVAAWSVIPAVLPPGALSSVPAVTALLLLQLAMLTVLLTVRWAVLTYVVWVVCSWTTDASRHALRYLGVVVMADIVTAAQIGVASVVARVSDAGVRSYLDAPRMGLDLVIAVDSPVARAALSGVDGFAVWYGAILAAGLRANCGVRWQLAIPVVVCLWLLSIALRVIVPAVLG